MPANFVRLLAGGLAAVGALGPSVAAPPEAAASTWVVGLRATAGDASVSALVEVKLADPGGSASVTVSGVPVVMSHDATTFSLGVSFSGQVGTCVETLSAGGAAPGQVTASGSTASGSLTGVGFLDCVGKDPAHTSFTISGSFAARTLDITTIPPSTVEAVLGTAEVITHHDKVPATPGLVVPPGAFIRTGADGSLTLRFADGSRLGFGHDTLASYHKPSVLDTVVHHLRGRLRHVVSRPSPPLPTPGYRVVTPIAAIDARGTEFVTDHTEVSLVGTTLVSVQEGLVEVADRRQQLTTLVAGLAASVGDAVPRVSPVLPVDGGAILQGQAGEFSWTSFPGAAGYLFEYTLSPSGFATANSPTVESPASAIPVPAGAFTEANGIVTFSLPVPDGLVPAGTSAQWRVFPTDAGGQVVAGATASDASVVIIE